LWLVVEDKPAQHDILSDAILVIDPACLFH
jgi:hypothetical protein